MKSKNAEITSWKQHSRFVHASIASRSASNTVKRLKRGHGGFISD